MVQETRQPEPNTRASLVDWAQSLVTRAKRARSVLSPWVQRALETGTSGRLRPLSLFEGDGHALVERVTRQGKGSRVWRPDLGRVSPAALDRFGGEIVRRHQPLADKYRVESPEWDRAQSTGLVLAPPAIGPAVSPEMMQPGPPSGLPSMSSAPPALQRQAVPPPYESQEQPSARLQPGARIFSRVEEVTPTATRPAEPGSPQQPSTEGGAQDEDRAAEGKASPAQAPAAPLQRTLESPPATRGEVPPLPPAAGKQEALTQRPASPPEKAPSSEAKATPEIDVEQDEQSMPAEMPAASQERHPPPVSPPPVKADGKAQPDRQLESERPVEEEKPTPVPLPEVGAAKAELDHRPEVLPVERWEDEELPATPTVPKVEAAAAEPGPRPEVPPLDQGGGEERSMAPSAPLMRARGVEPGPRPEVPPLDQGGDEEQPMAPSPPGVEVSDPEPAPRPEVPPQDQGGGEERPTGQSLSEAQATGMEPSRRGEVPVQQRVLLEDQSLPGGERTEADVTGLVRPPEIEVPGAMLAPGQDMPPEQRLAGQVVPAVSPGKGEPPVQGKPGPVRETPARKVPGLRPPSAGPGQPAERVEAGREPVGVMDERSVTDERPVPDPYLPILRKAPHASPVERGPVQRKAILPQARMGVQFEKESAMPVAPQGPLREGFWTEAAARRMPRTKALPLRAPIQAVMEGPHAVPEAPARGFAAEAPVQRLPLAVLPPPETESTGAVVVQRQNGNGPAVSAALTTEERETDLDQLARQVYPLVKRMLAVERERRLSR